MKKFLSPFGVMIFAVILGVVAGPAWYWLKASAIAAKATAIRQELVQEEQAKVDQRRAHGWDFWTVEMENLAQELKEDKAAIKKKSDDMEQREAKIAAEKLELEKVRADIMSIRRDIDERVISIKGDEAKNLRTLAQTYSALDATAAVAILREMDDATIVKILYLMKPDAVAAIFTQMATTAAPPPDGTLAKRAALLSDRIRLMRTNTQPNP